MERPDLRSELIHLQRLDLDTRDRLAATGELFHGYAADMEKRHVANAERLHEIVREHGWPGRSLVGSLGAEAAWLIALHAISRPDLQREFARRLDEAIARGDARSEHAAYLEDRIRFNERRPQVYGTIFDWDENDELNPWTIERSDEVEARRLRAGLPPLEEAIRTARENAARDNERPTEDHAARQREIEEWSRRVGWLPPETAGPGEPLEQ